MNYMKELICGKTVEIQDRAFAKINLFLNVEHKRNDGYHDIKSYMQSVSLCDNLKMRVKMSQIPRITVSVSGNPKIPSDERNLAYRAADAYMKWCKVKLAVEIDIEKNIPMEAGLAGGSSDAASVLRMINAVLSNLLPADELAMIGAGIGSDVPFCLFGGTKLCEGRGEILTHVKLGAPLYLVIAKSEESVSTPRMYRKLDEMYGNFDGVMNIEAEMKYSMLSHAIVRGDIFDIATNLYNIFEKPVMDICPKTEKIKEMILANGAMGAMLSGSGPSVFGIFESKEKAMTVAEKIGSVAVYAESI